MAQEVEVVDFESSGIFFVFVFRPCLFELCVVEVFEGNGYVRSEACTGKHGAEAEFFPEEVDQLAVHGAHGFAFLHVNEQYAVLFVREGAEAVQGHFKWRLRLGKFRQFLAECSFETRVCGERYLQGDVRQYFQCVSGTILFCEVLFYLDDLFTYFSCGQQSDKIDLVIYFGRTVEVSGTTLATALSAATTVEAATTATAVEATTTAAAIVSTAATATVVSATATVITAAATAAIVTTAATVVSAAAAIAATAIVTATTATVVATAAAIISAAATVVPAAATVITTAATATIVTAAVATTAFATVAVIAAAVTITIVTTAAITVAVSTTLITGRIAAAFAVVCSFSVKIAISSSGSIAFSTGGITSFPAGRISSFTRGITTFAGSVTAFTTGSVRSFSVFAKFGFLEFTTFLVLVGFLLISVVARRILSGAFVSLKIHLT